jgi:hypothetical protein
VRERSEQVLSTKQKEDQSTYAAAQLSEACLSNMERFFAQNVPQCTNGRTLNSSRIGFCEHCIQGVGIQELVVGRREAAAKSSAWFLDRLRHDCKVHWNAAPPANPEAETVALTWCPSARNCVRKATIARKITDDMYV